MNAIISYTKSFYIKSPLPNGWARCLLLGLGSICGLDVFKPTIVHGLTKLSTQPYNLLGDGGTLVLSHVICQAQFATDLKSQYNIIYIISIIRIIRIICINDIIRIIYIIRIIRIIVIKRIICIMNINTFSA
jgi:hypothetical protein